MHDIKPQLLLILQIFTVFICVGLYVCFATTGQELYMIQNTAAEHLLGYWRSWSLEDVADDETMALWSIFATEEILFFSLIR